MAPAWASPTPRASTTWAARWRGVGDRYFTANNGGAPDVTGPGIVSQNVDLSAGDTATQIAAGTAAFELSAFMTSYAATDVAHIHVDFLDGGGGSLGDRRCRRRRQLDLDVQQHDRPDPGRHRHGGRLGLWRR